MKTCQNILESTKGSFFTVSLVANFDFLEEKGKVAAKLTIKILFLNKNKTTNKSDLMIKESGRSFKKNIKRSDQEKY